MGDDRYQSLRLLVQIQGLGLRQVVNLVKEIHHTVPLDFDSERGRSRALQVAKANIHPNVRVRHLLLPFFLPAADFFV